MNYLSKTHITARCQVTIVAFTMLTALLHSGCKTVGSPLQKLANLRGDRVKVLPLPDSKQEATPRALHSGFWTGSGMLVWGGVIDQQTERFDDAGSVYYPSTNRWFPVKRAEMGSRYYHAAIWSGDSMIAWGGIDVNTGAPTASGVRINPDEEGWHDVSSKDAPSARSGHSAVWTGEQMLVWGGVDAEDHYLSDGALYNPKTETWTKINSLGAPTGRAYHSAHWTGQVMVVWGGGDNNNWLDTGAIYDPRTDQWSQINPHGGPTARVSQTAVWTGSHLIVWGGRNTSDQYMSDGYAYDLATNLWTKLPKGPRGFSGRELHTAIWTGKEMIIWGGQNSQRILGDGAAYNPATKEWRRLTTSDKSVARCEHSAVWTGQEMLVFGGKGPDNQLIKTKLGFKIPLESEQEIPSAPQEEEEHLVQVALPSN